LNLQRDIDLVNGLREYPAETGWFEFKENNSNPEKIGKLISAISNAARIDDKECGFIVWGINDNTHDVTGTTFQPTSKKVGNEPYEFWLNKRFQPNIALQFRSVAHPDGNLILLEIPAPTAAPIAFNGIAYDRIGSATPALMDNQKRYQLLIRKIQPYSWEQGLAANYITEDDVFNLIDYPSYFSLTNQPLPDGRLAILSHLEADKLIISDVGGRWNITNLGAILFAKDLDKLGPSISRKGVRFVSYGGKSKADNVIKRKDGKRGYATGFEGLLAFINNLLPNNEHIGESLRQESPLFPKLAIRELIANSLIHQDMTITGTGPIIELFSDRIEITNPGEPLMEVDRMIDLPPRSRNERLAALMRRMGMCEEQGSGLDKVFTEVEMYQLPPPLLLSSSESMRVALYAPRKFAEMSVEERVRACYYHAILKWIGGERMKNSSLCARFGIQKANAAQASAVIQKTLDAGLIKHADTQHPRAGYYPIWA